MGGVVNTDCRRAKCGGCDVADCGGEPVDLIVSGDQRIGKTVLRITVSTYYGSECSVVVGRECLWSNAGQCILKYVALCTVRTLAHVGTKKHK